MVGGCFVLVGDTGWTVAEMVARGDLTSRGPSGVLGSVDRAEVIALHVVRLKAERRRRERAATNEPHGTQPARRSARLASRPRGCRVHGSQSAGDLEACAAWPVAVRRTRGPGDGSGGITACGSSTRIS